MANIGNHESGRLQLHLDWDFEIQLAALRVSDQATSRLQDSTPLSRIAVVRRIPRLL